MVQLLRVSEQSGLRQRRGRVNRFGIAASFRSVNAQLKNIWWGGSPDPRPSPPARPLPDQGEPARTWASALPQRASSPSAACRAMGAPLRSRRGGRSVFAGSQQDRAAARERTRGNPKRLSATRAQFDSVSRLICGELFGTRSSNCGRSRPPPKPCRIRPAARRWAATRKGSALPGWSRAARRAVRA